MAYKVGRSTVTGTGSKTIVTALTGAPTYCRLTIAEDTNLSLGMCDGTAQDYISTGPSEVSGNNKIAYLVDTGGTVVFEATWTSFGTSGASGTVVINVVTNSTGARPVILEAGN